jgi:hypothetical protein
MADCKANASCCFLFSFISPNGDTPLRYICVNFTDNTLYQDEIKLKKFQIHEPKFAVHFSNIKSEIQ